MLLSNIFNWLLSLLSEMIMELHIRCFLAVEGVRELPAIAVRAATAAQRASRGETGSLHIGFTR